MNISRKDEYKLELQEILRFIVNDKISTSKEFRQELDKPISRIFPINTKKLS